MVDKMSYNKENGRYFLIKKPSSTLVCKPKGNSTVLLDGTSIITYKFLMSIKVTLI